MSAAEVRSEMDALARALFRVANALDQIRNDLRTQPIGRAS
jgi:hypothetical protein